MAKTSKVLLVEDELDVLRVTRDTLKHLGLEVITARDYEEATFLIDPEITAVISDMLYRGGGGLHLLETLSQMYGSPSPSNIVPIPIRILYTSSDITERIKNKVRDEGGIGILSKPVDFFRFDLISKGIQVFPFNYDNIREGTNYFFPENKVFD